jgi:alpha-tubulin suppressor-like RCC1 family protein
LGEIINAEEYRILPDQSKSVNLTQGVAILVAGSNFYCALLLDRVSIFCWGQNLLGQLGRVDKFPNETFIDHSVPHNVSLPDVKFVRDLSAGSNHVCAVVDTEKEAGLVTCWGDNSRGQLGDIKRRTTIHPEFAPHTCNNQSRLAPEPTPTRTTLAPGASAAPVTPEPTLAPHETTTTAPPTPRPTEWFCAPVAPKWVFDDQFPKFRVATNDPVSRVFAGPSHTCALTSLGIVYCWGSNSAEQLGFPRNSSLHRSHHGVDESEPLNVHSDAVFDVSLSTSSTCMLFYNGDVLCVGSDAQGELGKDIDPILLPVLLGSSVPLDVFDRTVKSVRFGEKIKVAGSGFAHHIVGGSSNHCFSSKFNTMVCWGSNFLRMFRGQVSAGVNSTVSIFPGDGAPVLQIAESRAQLTFAALTSTGQLRVFGDRPYFENITISASRPMLNNASAVLSFGKLSLDLLHPALHDPPCPNPSMHGRDCSCDAVVPRYATCFGAKPTLRTPVERSETLTLTAPLQMRHDQPILGKVMFVFAANLASSATPAPVLTVTNSSCASITEATFVFNASIKDLQMQPKFDVIRGCKAPGAANAKYEIHVRDYDAVGEDPCTTFTVKLDETSMNAVTVQIVSVCNAEDTADTTIAAIVVSLFVIAVIVLLLAFFLRRYLRRQRDQYGSSDTVRPSAGSSSPTDALSSGGRQSITSSGDSGLTAGHYARVSLGDDPTDVNVHAYDKVELGSNTGYDRASARMTKGEYEQPSTRLDGKGNYDNAPVETANVDDNNDDESPDPDAPQPYQKMPQAPMRTS